MSRQIDYKDNILLSVAKYTGEKHVTVKKIVHALSLYVEKKTINDGSAIIPEIGTISALTHKEYDTRGVVDRSKVKPILKTKISMSANNTLKNKIRAGICSMFAICCILGDNSPVGAADNFTPTPLLIGSDYAANRIVIYHSLTCIACKVLDAQITEKKSWLKAHDIAIEYRMVATGELSLKRSMRALELAFESPNDADIIFEEARLISTSSQFFWDEKKTNRIIQWMDWYSDRIEGDHVSLPESHPLGPGITTPTTFVLHKGKPLARIQSGISILEVILLPYYENGIITDSFR